MDDLLIAVFVAVEGAHAFSAFMPSAFTIRTFVQDEAGISQLRAGYLPALAFLLILAGVVSAMRKNATPLLVAGIVGVFMIGLYEYSIAARRTALEGA